MSRAHRRAAEFFAFQRAILDMNINCSFEDGKYSSGLKCKIVILFQSIYSITIYDTTVISNMLRFYSSKIRPFRQHLKVSYPFNIFYRLSSTNKITTIDDFNKFLEYQKKLNVIQSSSKLSLDFKIQFLLSDINNLDISDLNLNIENYEYFLIKLINDYKINFNESDILGIGKFFKILARNSINGLTLIKNCGILELNSELTTEIFIKRYNDKLRLLTIDLLIENKYYTDAIHFIHLYESIHPNLTNPQIVKFKFKLMKINELSNTLNSKISALDIIENSLIHIYTRELLKSNNYSIEKKLEYFLLIIFKWFTCSTTSLSTNQIHLLNSTFLSILYRQVGIPYSIYVSYFIKLYPKSIPTLVELKLLSTSKDFNKYIPILDELPTVNIRDELIQSCEPYMEDLSLLYSKYLHEFLPNRTTTRQLFNLYVENVKKYQKNENRSYLKTVIHPFSKFHHDTSILTSFINYTFATKVGAGFFKPKVASNMIIKFYNTVNIAHLDYNKSTVSKNHDKQLSNVVLYFVNTESKNFNFPIVITILSLINKFNIRLNVEDYIEVLNSLIKLDLMKQAKEFYNFIITDPVVSHQLKPEHISKFCYKYAWPYPEILLRKTETDILNQHKENTFTYNENYLTGDLSPQTLINYLDSKLAQLK